MEPYCAVITVLALFPTVAARKGRSGGGGGGAFGGVDQISYDAPPLEIATLAAYSVFLLVSLIQLYIILRALSQHATRLPAIGAALALTILAVGDGLGVGWYVNKWIVDGPTLSLNASIHLSAVFSLFDQWTDPAIFAALALVLYSRYRTVDKSSSTVFIALASAVGIIFVVTIALAAAGCAFLDSAEVIESHRNEDGTISDENYQKVVEHFWISNRCYTAFLAFHMLGIILLAIVGFFVKAHLKNDKVTSTTLFAIIPLIFIHAVARIVIAVFDTQILRHGLLSFEEEYKLDFASILVEGLMYAVVMSILTFLLVRPHLWEKLSHSAPMGSSRSSMA